MGDAYAPFHLAIKIYWTQLWSPLLDAGEYPSIPDPDGNTALHHLAVDVQKSKKKNEPKRELWSNIPRFHNLGLDNNAPNNDGESPLVKFVGAGSCETSLARTSCKESVSSAS
jgi:hypothetical protein